MKAQAYYDNEPLIRIFKNSVRIADLPFERPCDAGADAALKAIGFKRRGKWQDADFGKEAEVRMWRPRLQT